MKKIVLIIFVSFSCLIFYQIVLGKNGLIEGYRSKIEKEKRIWVKSLLEKEKKQLEDYIYVLKNNPDALNDLAQEYGFSGDDVNFIKINDKVTKERPDNTENYLAAEVYLNNLINTQDHSALDERINKLRLWLSIIFYLFFGIFIMLIMIGEPAKND